MIHVYALSSLEHNYIYVGMTECLNERIQRHNAGREKTTKFYTPFKLIYSEACADRKKARVREKYWKSGTGKEKLRGIRNEKNR